ncbi:sodium channel, voltage-gated, type I, beta a [Nerophis ophidion]|uniref:sodium channel, voltage-gated, type I, beta a n=1 Tax=Nerophis ophidion TaxID=159077 RepID=UPI002ADF45AF|nr:sodium channel, voltage-gated, type I, beta a [Nerophis ophidion]XP_061737889.1 sodium channel, voltage-gated, type I, beta a [Nerophis ophidion]XP_061737890.1 sodium channel, voltage-gated, type I, beta a [Nerophis ophidion]XP_061737891.1 sodium channel, voltage-gated, type I, beta a [Nerophis ophidion]
MPATRALVPLVLLMALQVLVCGGACVEVDSDTEAVANQAFKLGCISCKKRGEVKATASVTWLFKATDDHDFDELYMYAEREGKVLDPRFYGRLHWNGSKNTEDLQDGSIYILNVSYNDTGRYQCKFRRMLLYPNSQYETNHVKNISMKVVPRVTRGMASIMSEVMMYVSIIGLQLWLLVEMIYCYRKISAAGEEALRESAAEYLAVESESKDTCADVEVAE